MSNADELIDATNPDWPVQNPPESVPVDPPAAGQKVFKAVMGPSKDFTQTFDEIEGYELDPRTGQLDQSSPIIRTRPFEERVEAIQAKDEGEARFVLEMRARDLAATRKGVIYELREIEEVTSS